MRQLQHLRVAIIGAGFAGIGAAMQLARAGEHSLAVLERAGDVGGTWRDNVYPGVACDVPSHLYSFSFAPRADWPRRYARGGEILQYLQSCAAEAGVRERLQLGTSLYQASWQEDAGLWELQTSRGAMTASVLVLATGRFTEPHIPDIDGLADFSGPVFHTARWQPDAALSGGRVGVVGTGASAVQVVPHLVDSGADVTVFQRSAPWVLPKDDRRYSAAERADFLRDDALRQAHRAEIFEEMDRGFSARLAGSGDNAALRRRALEHLHTQVTDPQLRSQLTPDYAAGCKRVLLSDQWYPALTSDHVTVENSPLKAVDATTATAGSGRQHQLDALIFATGFEAHRPAIASSVHGVGGTLLQHWREGMTSYASTAMSGFPNCFVLGGPNAALGHNSALAILEVQISHLVDALKHIPEGAVCEVKQEAERSYTTELDARAANTVWTAGGCTSWYRDESTGRVTLLWPGTAREFARRHSHFDPAQFVIRAAQGNEPAPDYELQEVNAG